MKIFNLTTWFGTWLMIVMLAFSGIAYAESEKVDTDFGPVYYLEDNETVDYQKTQCEVGLQLFIAEKGNEFDEFLYGEDGKSGHMSSPDMASNLMGPMVAKYEAYREMLREEYFKYNAKVGKNVAVQFEELERCFALINNEIDERQTNITQNFAAGASDRAAIRYRDRWALINDRFEDLIHFPFAQFMARMKSFADGLPCYTSTCVQ